MERNSYGFDFSYSLGLEKTLSHLLCIVAVKNLQWYSFCLLLLSNFSEITKKQAFRIVCRTTLISTLMWQEVAFKIIAEDELS